MSNTATLTRAIERLNYRVTIGDVAAEAGAATGRSATGGTGTCQRCTGPFAGV